MTVSQDVLPNIETETEERKRNVTDGSSLFTAFIVCIMFVGSVSGVFVEQSNLAYTTPEKLNLPSYLSVASQVSNVAVLVYLALRKCITIEKLQHYTILLTAILGGISYILMGFFWKDTIYVFGENHSVPLFVLVFICSIYDCTSNITLLPFMAILPSRFLSPMFVGQALAYFIPGLTVLIQGQYEPSKNSTNLEPTNELRISVESFFIFMGVLMFLCPVCYMLVLYLPSIKLLHVQTGDKYQKLSTQCSYEETISFKGSSPTSEIIFLLSTLFVVTFLQNGILWSILSYALAPYGAEIYNLGVTVGTIVAALVCLSFYWYPVTSIRLLYALSFLLTGFVAYMFVVSFRYPNPWLKTNVYGKVMAVMIAIVAMSLAPYTRLMIVTILGDHSTKYLFHAGIVSQLGSCIGSVVIFLVINFSPHFPS